MNIGKMPLWSLLLLLPAVSAAEMLSLSVGKGNVRGTPGGAVVWEAYQYTPFRVIDRQGPWVEIEDFEGDSGWIHKSVLGKKPAVIVKTTKANLRDKPASDAAVVWVLEKGYPLKLLKKQGAWCQVTDDKDAKGWLHGSTLWGSGEDDVPDGAGTQVLSSGEEEKSDKEGSGEARETAGGAAARGTDEYGDSGPDESGPGGEGGGKGGGSEEEGGQ